MRGVTRGAQGWMAHNERLELNVVQSDGGGNFVNVALRAVGASISSSASGSIGKPSAPPASTRPGVGGTKTPPAETPPAKGPLTKTAPTTTSPAEPGPTGTTRTADRPGWPATPEHLPTIDQAKRIATDLVNAFGMRGPWAVEVRDGMTSASSVTCSERTQCPAPSQALYSYSVVIHSMVNGIVVQGLDWMVEVGDRGAIQSVSGVAAAFDRIGNYPLRSIETAYRHINDEQLRGVVPIALGAPELADRATVPHPSTTTIRVTTAHLGYEVWYGVDHDKPATFIVPTYEFIGVTNAPSPWTANLIALDDAFVKLNTPSPGRDTSPPSPSPNPLPPSPQPPNPQPPNAKPPNAKPPNPAQTSPAQARLEGPTPMPKTMPTVVAPTRQQQAITR